MSNFPQPSIIVDVDVTNPGQFFACCGLLELADRHCPGAEGCFERDRFCIACPNGNSIETLLDSLIRSTVSNTMSIAQQSRLEQLSSMSRQEYAGRSKIEKEKKTLEALRREEPIILKGAIVLRIDWFRDEFAGGSRFKTWAGQQSVLDITTAMHVGIKSAGAQCGQTIWNSTRGIGLPFNFDSDLGGQGSALDIGFSFDPLAGSAATRIEGTCKPALELLSFIGLQRFRPRQIGGENRYIYTAWHTPLPISAAACAACHCVRISDDPTYEFRLLYRTKYLKSFCPAIPFQGDRNE
ncbi:MAG: type I-U CRISPR-associated protein Cas8c [Phycisphaerales bacterium]|jgi:CRISPR-associated protein Csb3